MSRYQVTFDNITITCPETSAGAPIYIEAARGKDEPFPVVYLDHQSPHRWVAELRHEGVVALGLWHVVDVLFVREHGGRVEVGTFPTKRAAWEASAQALRALFNVAARGHKLRQALARAADLMQERDLCRDQLIECVSSHLEPFGVLLGVYEPAGVAVEAAGVKLRVSLSNTAGMGALVAFVAAEVLATMVTASDDDIRAIREKMAPVVARYDGRPHKAVS